MSKLQLHTAIKALLIVCAIGLVVIGVLPTSTHASSDKEVELQVVTEELAPFNYMVAGKIVGQNTDIVKAVLARAGIKFTIKSMPWGAAYELAQTKPNVLIFTIMQIPPRAGAFQWIRALGALKKTKLYTLKNKPRPWPTSLQEAQGVSIGCGENAGAQCQELSSLKFSKLKASVAGADPNYLKLLEDKQVDFIASEDARLQALLRENGSPPDAISEVMELYSAQPYFALSNKTSRAVTKRLQVAYDELLAEKKINPLNLPLD